MKLPSPEQLAQLSLDLDYEFPPSYLQFVRSPRPQAIAALQKKFPRGWFVTSREELGAMPTFLFEMLMPFFVSGPREAIALIKPGDFELPGSLNFVGFDVGSAPVNDEPEVTVFSIHALVAQWSDFHDFFNWLESGLNWREWHERRKPSGG